MRADVGQLATDVDQGLHTERQGGPGDHAGDSPVVLPRHAGEVLGVVRRNSRDRQRPATALAWIGEGLDQRVRHAGAEPTALAEVKARVRFQVHGRGESMTDADPDHPLRGPVGELVGELDALTGDRKSTRLNSSHPLISYAV